MKQLIKIQETDKILVIILLIMILSTSSFFIFSKKSKVDDYDKLIDLASKVHQSYEIIKAEKLRLGIDISNHESGMIGPELTGITTTLGSKESKMTSVNPNFIGVIVRYIGRLGLREGDAVAVNLSSSFPALNIQTILALEYLGYEPVIVSSLGASTYGATDPDFTYLDMEYLLFERGIIKHKSIFYSLGGDYDTGENMDQKLLRVINQRLYDKGYNLYMTNDLGENLKNRLSVYKSTQALINVGGNTVSETEADLGYFHQYGYIASSRMINFNGQGLIGSFLNQGKDVIHLLNIKDIAIDFHMPIAPEYTGRLGVGGVYYRVEYGVNFGVLTIIFFIVGLVIYGKRKKTQVEKAIQRIL